MYILVVVDRASRFVFAYASKFKDSMGVARTPLETSPRSCGPLSITSDKGGKTVDGGATPLYRWVGVQLYHGLADHPRDQAAAEKMRKVASLSVAGEV